MLPVKSSFEGTILTVSSPVLYEYSSIAYGRITLSTTATGLPLGIQFLH